MSINVNEAGVRRFFKDILDGGDSECIDSLFTPDCVIHRPESPDPIRGIEGIQKIVIGVHQTFNPFMTEIHNIFGEKDRIACRLTHSGTFRQDLWVSRIGKHAVDGKRVTWSATVIFRFEDGKIAEEWVCRDELGMLIQVGIL